MGVTEWVQGQPENFSETSSQKLRARIIKSGGFRVLWMIKALCLICSAGGKKRKRKSVCASVFHFYLLGNAWIISTKTDRKWPLLSQQFWVHHYVEGQMVLFSYVPYYSFFHVNIKANEMLKQCLNYHLAPSQEHMVKRTM